MRKRIKITIKATVFILLAFLIVSLLRFPLTKTIQITTQTPISTPSSSQTQKSDVPMIGKINEPNKDLKCTFPKGEIYFKGDNALAIMGEEDQQRNMLIKDKCVWVWEADGDPSVVKCADSDATTPQIYLDRNEIESGSNYTCEESEISDDLFTIPQNLQFTEVDELPK